MIIYNRTEYKALSTRQYSKEKKRLADILKLGKIKMIKTEITSMNG